jgi:hypothetical protein
MNKGEQHSADTRRRIAETVKEPLADRLARDREALRLIGPVHTWEFAERVGCSEKMAVYRLRRLYEAGLATRSPTRRPRGYKYEAA